MDGAIEYLASGAAYPSDVLNFLRDGLLSLGLPRENVIFGAIDKFEEGGCISGLKDAFKRIYDAQMIAAADSCKISENYKNGDFGCDREFIGLMEYVNANTAEELAGSAFLKLQQLLATNPDYYVLLTSGSTGWYMGTNWLDGFEGGNNSLIINRMTVLKEKAERFE
jgi:hypothetical protein